MQDAYCQALVAAVLLEGHIERLSCSISRGHPGGSRCLGSHQQLQSQGCSRSCTRHLPSGPQAQIPPVEGYTGDAAKMWVLSTSPM